MFAFGARERERERERERGGGGGRKRMKDDYNLANFMKWREYAANLIFNSVDFFRSDLFWIFIIKLCFFL